MLISTKGCYALRGMIALVEHWTDVYISHKGLAERQGISEEYLERIIRLLVKARVLESVTIANLRKKADVGDDYVI